jgi:hypothetical protein
LLFLSKDYTNGTTIHHFGHLLCSIDRLPHRVNCLLLSWFPMSYFYTIYTSTSTHTKTKEPIPWLDYEDVCLSVDSPKDLPKAAKRELEEAAKDLDPDEHSPGDKIILNVYSARGLLLSSIQYTLQPSDFAEEEEE